jgi:CBS domain containing-hemolysin-like protein
MSTTEVAMLVAALACVPIAGFFAAAQTALERTSLTRAHKQAEEGLRGARALVRLLGDPARNVTVVALLVLSAQVTGAALLTVLLHRRMDAGLAVLVAALLASTALFVAAEVAPKTLALQHSERVARLTAPLAWWAGRLLSPIAGLLIRLGNVIAPGRGLAQGPFVTEEVLRDMIDVAESDEVIEETERAMIHSIFELGDTVVREIMIPRPDMVTVSADDRLGDVLDVMLSAGHSRIPVYRDDRDRIVGLVYAKDVLRRLHTGASEDDPWYDLMRAPYFVPELKQVDALLRELQAEKVHLAIVVDEYGATAGLVTIEDILEEIVGEIVDEYDREEVLVEQLAEGGVRVDARLPVDELEDLLTCELPDEEWDTVGGLLFGMLGHVPQPGEHIEVDGVRLTAERIQGRRIAKVLVDRVAAVPDPEEAERP